VGGVPVILGCVRWDKGWFFSDHRFLLLNCKIIKADPDINVAITPKYQPMRDEGPPVSAIIAQSSPQLTPTHLDQTARAIEQTNTIANKVFVMTGAFGFSWR